MLLSRTGNENIHLLTSDKRQVLRIEMYDWEGKSYFVEYDNFKVDSEQTQYRLSSIGKCRGTAGQYDKNYDKKAVLSQGKPRDAAVNVYTYRILQLHRTRCFSATARPPCW